MYSSWLDLLFPAESKCLLCRAGKTEEGSSICENCAREIFSWQENFLPCSHCGRLVPVGQHCRYCGPAMPPFTAARAVGPYQGILKRAAHDLKFHGNRRIAHAMGSLMAETVFRERWPWELIIPVPLDRRRMEERGFNQAELLARQIAWQLGSAVLKDVLVKTRPTPAQAELTRRARLINIKGAFQVTLPSKIHKRKLLLVDDVLTTGATAAEAASILLSAGALEVYVITWATGLQIAPINTNL